MRFKDLEEQINLHMITTLLKLAGPPPAGYSAHIHANFDITLRYKNEHIGHIYYTVRPVQDVFCYGYLWGSGMKVTRYENLREAIIDICTKHRMDING